MLFSLIENHFIHVPNIQKNLLRFIKKLTCLDELKLIHLSLNTNTMLKDHFICVLNVSTPAYKLRA